MPGDVSRKPGRAGRVCQAALLVLALLLAGALLTPRLLRLQPYVVLTGSMSPAFPVGGLVYVRSVDPSQVRVGDPITFRLSAAMVVTHRVVARDDANRIFRTKGDANRQADDFTVPYANLIGKAVVCVPLLGYAAAFAGTPSGRAACGAAALCMALLAFLPGVFARRPGAPRKTTRAP